MGDGAAGSVAERAGARAGRASPPSAWAGRALSALDPLRLAGAALFLALWQGASEFVSPIILPGPIGVFERVAADFWSAPALSYFGLEDASLAGNLLYTAENVAIATLLGTAIGATLGLLSARLWFVRAAMDPVMMTAGTVPILIAAPFLLIWFGVGRASAVSLVTFYVVVILYISAQRAALNLDPIYEQLRADARRRPARDAGRDPHSRRDAGDPRRLPHCARRILGTRGGGGAARLADRHRQGDRSARRRHGSPRAFSRRFSCSDRRRSSPTRS